MSNFMETLMESEIFKGSEKRSEEEMRQDAYDSGEVLIPFLTKKFPNPDQAISAVISILAQIALLQPDKMKRLILLNNVQSAVLGMVDLYEKGELDESEEEPSEEEMQTETVSASPDQDGLEEEDDQEEYDQEEYEEDDGEGVDDGEGEEEGEEEYQVKKRVPKVVEEEDDDALELAGYHPPEDDEDGDE